LLHAWRLPFLEKLTGMDAEWQLASEIAADENAVVSGASILDLASALVKVARLRLGVFTELHPAVVCFVPATRETLLSARILHLMSLLERGGVRREESSLSYPGIWLAAAAILTFVSLHAGLLSFAHQLLEKIV